MIAHISKESGKEQTVEEHLENTARLARHLGQPLGMGNLSWLTGIVHDLGKWRKAFEEYIRASASGKKTAKGSVNHSSAGAVFIYQRYYQGKPVEKLTAQLICQAVLSHHGLNDCMSPEGEDCFRNRVESLEGLDYGEVIGNLKKSRISETCLDEAFKAAVDEVAALQEMILEHKLLLGGSFAVGLAERMLLSILIDADRLDTAAACGDRKEEELFQERKPSWELLEENLNRKLESFPKLEGIFALRRQIAKECLDFAKEPPGIYRLTVPTGGAKTLSSMRYALHHALIYKKKRIFYIGPYLSILEQNSQVFREALGREALILEHHSNVLVESGSEEDQVTDQYRHLTENWGEAEVIITTFVQFLNTLFDGSTGAVRRLHNLADSVIIVDEIQSLPLKMIHMFNLAMNYLKYMCRATIILCSATQPMLESVPKPIEMSVPPDMIADVDGLYERLKRVTIKEKRGYLSTKALCEFLEELMETQDSLLVILNTRTAVRLVYQELANIYSQKEHPPFLVHLSTSMCPDHRMSCINRIRNKAEKEKMICISTSLIEAGVDLSFSCVVRSFAGLDSIAQAAGRCNRNGENEEGTVWLIHYDMERLGNLPDIRKGAACSEAVVEAFQKHKEKYKGDLLSRPAMNEFYSRYYYDEEQKRSMNYPLEARGTSLIELLGSNIKGKQAYVRRNGRERSPDLMFYQAFKIAGKEFAVIDQQTIGVLVPYGEGRELIHQLNGELSGKEIEKAVRRAQRFTINLYKQQLEALAKEDAIVLLKNGRILALKERFYDEKLGVVQQGKMETWIV